MTPIYYRSATQARDAGELDQFRASNAENKRTRDVIDAAISAHFDGWRLPAAAMDDILSQADPDRVALVLAATMDDRAHDGRFSRDNRAWAATVRRPDNEPDDVAAGRCWYTCRTHSAILDGFTCQFRRHLAEVIK